MPQSRMKFLNSPRDELRTVIADDSRMSLWILLPSALQHTLDIERGHPLSNFEVHDAAAGSVENGAQIVEDAAQVQVRNVDLSTDKALSDFGWGKTEAKQAPPTSAGNTKPCDTSSPVRLVCAFRSPCLRRLFSLSSPFVRLSFALHSPFVRLAFHMLFHRSNRIPDLVPVGVGDSEPSHVGGMQGESKANPRRIQGESKAKPRREEGD